MKSGFLLKMFRVNRFQLKNRKFPEGWTLVLNISSQNKNLVVGSVNGYNAAVSKSGNLVSVTSFGNNELFSVSQRRIGNKKYYSVLLRFFGAESDLKLVNASLYFKRFVNVECLEDETLTLLDSDCDLYDENYAKPTDLSREAALTCSTDTLANRY